MLVEIALMRVVIGKEDQARPPDMCCHDAFVPFAIIDLSAMPSQKASDPLGAASKEQRGAQSALGCKRELLLFLLDH